MSDAFSEYRWLPQYFVQQHKVGERTGQLVDNLEKVADRFSKDAKRTLMTAVIVYSGIVLTIAFDLAVLVRAWSAQCSTSWPRLLLWI